MGKMNHHEKSSPEEGHSHSKEKLSDQELQILANHSKLKILRYDPKTHRADQFYDFMDQCKLPGEETYVPEERVKNKTISEDTSTDYLQFFKNIEQGIPEGSVDVKIRDRVQEYRWHHGDYALVYDKQGTILYAMITFMDNVEKRELQQARERWKSGFSLLLAESIYYIESNLSQNRLDLQVGAKEYSRSGDAAAYFDSFISYGIKHHVVREDHEAYREFFDRKRLLGLFEAGVYEDVFEYRLHADNQLGRWIKANVRMTKYSFSDDIIIIIAYEDIDSQRQEIEELAQIASHDPLTGIFNRNALERKISERIAVLGKGELAAMFMVDLDHFKQVNDTFGHWRGDKLLKQVAKDLEHIFKEIGVVGRLGGDEFMVFVSGKITRQDVELMAAKAVNTLQFFMEDGVQVNVSASIGVAIWQEGDGFAAIYSKADQALYTAKRRGKCQYCFFARKLDSPVLKKEDSGSLGSVQLQALMEYMGGGIIVADISAPDWDSVEIIYTSPSYFKTIGYVEEDVEIRRQQLTAFIVEEDRQGFLEAVWRTAETGKMEEYCYRVRLPGSEKEAFRLIHVTYMPGGREGHYLIIGLISDIPDCLQEM